MIEKTIRQCRRYITANYPDTVALFLIGSYADRTAHKKSDVDIVWVKRRRLDWKEHVNTEEKLSGGQLQPQIQLVPFKLRFLKWHFDHSSTMAHAVQRGTILYGQRTKPVSDLMNRRLGLPSREWMSYWARHWITRYGWACDSLRQNKSFHRKFCRGRCDCTCMDDAARVLINFIILCLELKGIVPTSKFQTRKAIRKYVDDRTMRTINMTLAKSGHDEFLTLVQTREILRVARMFKRIITASGLLKVPPAVFHLNKGKYLATDQRI